MAARIATLPGGLQVAGRNGGIVVTIPGSGRVTIPAVILRSLAASRSGPLLTPTARATPAGASRASVQRSLRVTLPGGRQLTITGP